MPQMLWVNTTINATPKTRFIYPMSRTVGHTTADIADWPLYNGIDYSWDRNNTHMLGVFGIDSYDNFQGAYQFDRDYGIFRYGDRRVVQGMKLWTFGYGESSKTYERGYTDSAGPYVELQSGRYVWDGHYEWVEPHQTESWNEWWVPVAGTGGLTTLSRDVALNLEIPAGAKGNGTIALASTRRLAGAKIVVRDATHELLSAEADLDPAAPFRESFRAARKHGRHHGHGDRRRRCQLSRIPSSRRRSSEQGVHAFHAPTRSSQEGGREDERGRADARGRIPAEGTRRHGRGRTAG